MRIAICERDLKSCRIIEDVCNDILGRQNVECEFREYTSAGSMLSDGFPDILFLEIKEMGLLIRDVLSAMHAETYIIFLSEDKEQVLEAFGKNVCGFLVHPLDRNLVHDVLNASVLECLEKERFVYCKHGGDIERILFQDILYIQAYGRYSKIFVRGKTDYRLCDKCVSDWEDDLRNLKFISPHRSYIVNLRYVDKIEKSIRLLDGREVPYSIEKKEEFHQIIKRIKREEKGVLKNDGMLWGLVKE